MPRSTNPLINAFALNAAGAAGPAQNASLVTPSDIADLAVYAKSLRIYNPGGAAATVRVTYEAESNDATTVDLTMPPGLVVEPSAIRRIWATGTTGGLIIHAYAG